MHSLKDSSWLDGVDHHPEHGLIILLKSGREYRYPTAGPEHVEAIRGAESAGRYFNEHIKPHHEPKRS